LIILIAAVGRNGELGKDGNLLWHLPTDMRFFKETTTGHTIVMGRKTFDGFHGRRLPNRTHVVLSRRAEQLPEDVIAVSSPEEAIRYFSESKAKEEDLFVIGGGEIYTLFYPYAEKMYLTEVEQSFPEADTFFPPFPREDWSCHTLKEFSEEGLNGSIKEYLKK